jgi:hypothetical protein
VINGRSFFSELKRRKVYKVAAAYAVVSWLVIQISSTVLPILHSPEWVLQMLLVIVAVGFPIALVLAWAFELTPQGIKRAEDLSPGESRSGQTSRKLTAVIVVLALIAASMLVFQLVRQKSKEAAATSPPATAPLSPDKSIAVMPFDNLSSERENAYFAEGIQDEILARLAKIAALKVISRTSTQKYKSAPENLRQVA